MSDSGIPWSARRSFSRNRTSGFTLIELLIVIAIIGIIAALIIPNLLDALQKTKQKKTMQEVRTVGTMWFAWLTDQEASAAAGQGGVATLDWSTFSAVSAAGLEELLLPVYGVSVPHQDGWGNILEYGISSSGGTNRPFGVRSAGADRIFDSGYTIGAFVATDYAQDIVWVGGVFFRAPGLVSEN